MSNPLYAGVWYGDWADVTPPPTKADVTRGLVVSPYVLKSMAASAAGVAVTWEHSAMAAVQASDVGSERAAVAQDKTVVGIVKAAWVCGATGHAHAVFELYKDRRPAVVALVESGFVSGLSATHVVGSEEMIELSLTRSPARPKCAIAGRVLSITDYIARHPP